MQRIRWNIWRTSCASLCPSIEVAAGYGGGTSMAPSSRIFASKLATHSTTINLLSGS